LTVFDAPQKIFAAICAGAAGELLHPARSASVPDALRQPDHPRAPMPPRLAPLVHDPTLPDVILLDVGLPGLDGISAIARIRALHPGAKILILTVFDAPQKIFAAICAGAAGYLLNTASIAEVAEAIRQAVDGGAPMTPRVAKLVLERFSSMAAHALRSPDYSLTDREREVLEFMVQGLIKKEIAARLHVSVHTVATHIRRVYEKLQVTTNTAAVSKALREGLVSSRP
ncbi:MAG: LuxR C-terminal-related transcriptional regulator, partial [Acidobacteriota bacterium]